MAALSYPTPLALLRMMTGCHLMVLLLKSLLLRNQQMLELMMLSYTTLNQWVREHAHSLFQDILIFLLFFLAPLSLVDKGAFMLPPLSRVGGGIKRLFRKVDDRSSSYEAQHSGRVRRDGSYIIEEFLTTGGTDVKVQSGT